MFFSSLDIVTTADAHAYLKRRAADAVACYKSDPQLFSNAIELARHLARFW